MFIFMLTIRKTAVFMAIFLKVFGNIPEAARWFPHILRWTDAQSQEFRHEGSDPAAYKNCFWDRIPNPQAEDTLSATYEP